MSQFEESGNAFTRKAKKTSIFNIPACFGFTHINCVFGFNDEVRFTPINAAIYYIIFNKKAQDRMHSFRSAILKNIYPP